MALTDRWVSSAGTDTWANATSSSTPAAWATMLTDAVAGDRVNIIKDGTYSRGVSSDTFTSAGTTTSPIILRGCSAAGSPGNGFLGRTSGNGALITTNMPVIQYTTGRLTTPVDTIVESLNITSAITNNYTVSCASNSVYKSCKIENTGNNASDGGMIFITGGNSTARDCDISQLHASAACVNVSNLTIRLINNRISGGVAVTTSTGHAIVLGNVIFGSTNCLKTTSAGGVLTAEGNTLVSASGTAILIVTGSTALHSIGNNMITDAGAYGIDFVSAAGMGMIAYNRFRDNTSGNINLGTDWVSATNYAPVTTDTGGPETDYTAAGSNDYTLISASPGKGAGWFSYMDIGGLQRQETGGGSAVFNPLAQSIITVL